MKFRIVNIYGLLFFVIGFCWLLIIFARGESVLPKKRGPSKVSCQKIQEELTERIQKRYPEFFSEGKHPRAFSLAKHLPRMFVMQFWAIAALELWCAVLFLLTGLALLRGYPFQRPFGAVTLATDIILKTLIVTYHQCLVVPLRDILDGKNILLMYFVPDANPASKISSYVSGVKLIQADKFYYALLYSAFFLISSWLFTHAGAKKHFEIIRAEGKAS
ncbi:MAG: hypothetical protein JW847_05490 [Candidatus Omnitrophica bacterium]|nr:hypothetical protein [Candidatus Omnitrophota bacterium]